MQNNDMTVRASAWTIFLCILFGVNAVAIKVCLTGVGSFTAAGIRFAIAALVVFAWAKFKKIPLALDTKQRVQMLILSCIFMVQLSCFYHGIDKTTASHGVLISNVLPFMVMVMAHFLIPGDTITLRKAMGILLGFMGVFFLFFDEQDLTGDLKQGDLIVLMAVVMWSFSAIYVKKIIARYNPVQITLYPMLFGTPFFFIAGALWDDQMIKIITAPVIEAILYQSIVAAAFGFIAWNNLLQKFGATALHSFVFIMPLAGVFGGVMILGETLTVHVLVSVVLIIAGVAVVNWRKKPLTASVH